MRKYNPFKKSILAFFILLLTQPGNAQWCNTGFWTIGCSLDYIVTFTTSGGLTNINNPNTNCTNLTGTGYSYYSTMTHTGAIGTSVGYYILNNATWTEAYGMWVDFDGNGTFDPTEQVYNSSLSGGGSVNSSFTIPPSAVPGTTRLRVRCNFGTAPGPCNQLAEGEIEDYNFVITSPCVAPTNPGATNITSSTATVNWTPPSPTVGSDYVVTTSVTPPATGFTTTTASTGNVTGLTPSTLYYLYVRNKCSATSFSAWVSYQFTTLPPCYPPVGFNITNLTSTSATVNWNAWASAQSYDYIIDKSNQTPTTSTGITNTTNTFAPATPLTENTWYFVHIRSKCAGGEISNWSLDSFLTPIPCRPPQVTITNVSTDEAVASWPAVGSALYYEYAITTSSTPPAQGTKYNFTAIHTSALNDGKQYFIHTRSFCNSIGVFGISDWSTTSFKTFPTSVGNLDNKHFIEAYPNPVSGILNINLNGIVTGSNTITITDISGKTLRTNSINTNKTTIDMADFTKGIYLLRYSDDTHNEVIKITKQ